MKLKFFVTTPIYYVNDVPHIGNAYATIAADILAMWNRVLDNEVFFLTGLDENSVKTVKAAKEKGITNLHEYTDSMAKIWKNAWSSLKISNNDFIRTTEDRIRRPFYHFLRRFLITATFTKVNMKACIVKAVNNFTQKKT
jgi:methionyl-tRNA synthetase